MNNFDYAIDIVLEQEGLFTIDSGGPTKYGITLQSLDIDIDGDGDIDIDDIKKLTRDQAIVFYKMKWWDKYRYYKIVDQYIAAKVFSLAVNMGARQAGKIIQRAVRSCGLLLKEDGVLGPVSMGIINGLDANLLIVGIRSEAAGFYRLIASKNDGYEKYLNGWLNRAYS